MKLEKKNTVGLHGIQRLIVEIRGNNVILDHDLAALYGVQTKVLNQVIKRNADRFPDDFVFRITPEEKTILRSQADILNGDNRSQSVTGSQKHRDPRYLPYVFTEHGALMAANVLRSPKAIEMSVFIVRAFVKFRQVLISQYEMSKRLDQIEKILLLHDTQLKELFDNIRPLLLPPLDPPKKQIGFGVKEPKKKYGKKSIKSRSK